MLIVPEGAKLVEKNRYCYTTEEEETITTRVFKRMRCHERADYPRRISSVFPTVADLAMKIPERFRLECLINRTLAAIRCNEMEEAITCLGVGKQGARALEKTTFR